MASLLSERAQQVQDRNRAVAKNFLCECLLTIRGVLCQDSKDNPTTIGDRLVIEVEDIGHGASLALILPAQDRTVGHVEKGEAEVLLPFFLEPCFVVSDW